MRNREQAILGIHETAGQPIQIKNVTMAVAAIEPVYLHDPTMQKKLHELHTFQQLGVLPGQPSLPTQYIRSSFHDARHQVHQQYFFGISFAQDGFLHYIKTTGNGCGESIKLAHAQQELFHHIELISGICLYGPQKFLLTTQTGTVLSLTARNFSIQEPIAEIWVDEHFSLYEIEALIGLSSFINGLCAQNRNIRTIHLDIPKGQYYLYLAEAYQNNLLSPELFQRCMAEIDKRHERIFHAYRKRLHVANIHRITPLVRVEEYLHARVSQRQAICLQVVQEILAQDHVWRKILAVSPITQWKELSYLAYTLVFLKVGKKERHKAVLQIDDPIEEKIQITAARMIKQLGERLNYRVWGIYPLQKVVLNPAAHPDSDLYHCPQIQLNVSMIKKIMAQSRLEKAPI